MSLVPPESICRKAKIHDFEISRDLPDALIECCVECGERVIYNKRDGMYDTNKHLRAHFRDTLQPYGREAKLFREVYGWKPVETAIKTQQGLIAKSKRDEKRKELKEKRIAFRRRSFKGQGKTDEEIEQELQRYKFKTTGIQK